MKDLKRLKKFDFNWGGQGNLSLNYSIAKNIDAKNIIETGVAYGWSSLAILTHLDLSKIGTLTSIDMPFWGTQDEDKIGCVIPKRFFKYWKLIRLPDRDAVPKVIKKNANFDLCHYDSDKSYGGKIGLFPNYGKLYEMVVFSCAMMSVIIWLLRIFVKRE